MARTARALMALSWVAIPLACSAQAPQPAQTAGLLRGVLIARDTREAGEFSVRTSDNEVVRYRFDRKTYVERDHRMADIPGLETGEPVEVISDQLAGWTLRYARTVHVIPPPASPRPLTMGVYRALRPEQIRPAEDRPIPEDALTFSGVAGAVEDGRFTLHMREGERTILLLPETRYLENGASMRASDLKPYLRVFVRAVLNVRGETEAYQIIWGRILEPK